MNAWLVGQLDYILLWHGLALVLLAGVCLKLSRKQEGIPWKWLGLFGLIQGLGKWLDMLAFSVPSRPGLQVALTLVMAGSWLPLMEFGRPSGWRYRRRSLWIYPILLVFAGAGGAVGINGLRASCSYALGVPAAAIGGWYFLAEARKARRGRRWLLGLAGAALAAYGLVTALSVPKISCFPVSILNQEAMGTDIGFPLPLAGALCAAAVAFAIARLHFGSSEDRAARVRRGLAVATLLMLLAGGWWVTNWCGRAADEEMRERILFQATKIAETIDPQQVRQLSFTAADKDRPQFRRLRSQMVAFGQAIHHRSIYSMALRNNVIVFGPENLDEQDPLASPPGTIYEEPTPENYTVLKNGIPYTEGPSTDEYGTFVSGFGPVRDPRTGRVLMVVGLDILADDWQSEIESHRLVPILITLALALICLVSDALSGRCERPRGGNARWWRHTGLLPTAACGLVLTLAAVLFARDTETRSRRLTFAQVANGLSASIVQTMRDLRDHQLAGLARFVEGSQDVSREEFSIYAGPLARSAAVQAFEWAPRIPAAEKANAETCARREGLEHFAIFEQGPQGTAAPSTEHDTYYPVLYVEPLAGNEHAVGFDLGSEPIQRSAIEEAARTGLPTATVPITQVKERAESASILLYYPVFENGRPEEAGQNAREHAKTLRGFALAVLRPQSTLDEALSHVDGENLVAGVDLFHLKPGEAPQWLASWPERPGDRSAAGVQAVAGAESGLSHVFPLFGFGRTYAICVHPGSAFLTAHPARAGWVACLVGLVLTCGVTGLVGLMGYRRSVLQQEVRMHAAALDATQKYRVIYESSRDAIATLAPPQWRFTAGNPAAIKLFAAKDELELCAAHPADLSPEYQPDGVLSSVKARTMIEMALRDGSHSFDWTHKRLDGQEFAALVSLTKASLGDRCLLQASVRDVTARNHAEQTLRTLSRAVEQSPAAVVITNTDGIIEYVNPQFTRATGYTFEEAVGQNPRILKSGHTPPQTFEQMWKIIKAGGEWHGEICNRRKNGELYWESASISPVIDAKGHTTHFVAVKIDISERKQAEAALRTSEERYRTLYESSRDAIMLLVPPDWKFTAGNPAAIKLFAIKDEAEICRTAPLELSPEYQPDGTLSSVKARQMTEAALRDGSHFFEWTHKRLSGEEFGAAVLLTCIKLNDQILLQATVRDITERQRTEAELLFKSALLEAQSEAGVDGILIVNNEQRVVLSNRRFAEMWGVPQEILATHDDELTLGHVLRQVRSPQAFLAKVRDLYSHPERKSRDELELTDGRVFDRYSSPLIDANSKSHGRIWYFRDITERKRGEKTLQQNLQRQVTLNILQQDLLGPGDLAGKLKMITGSLVRLFDADFCRIWISKAGDLCGSRCVHSEVAEGSPVCRNRDQCLHLMASAGRYTHIDGPAHRRVPFGCYKIGQIASGKKHSFLTNDVVHDPQVHNHDWARELGLVSFAGYQLRPTSGVTIGVLALFSKHVLSPEDDAMLESLANTTTQVIIGAKIEEEQRALQMQLAQAQRLESVGHLAAGIAHEINTPAQFVSDNTRFLRNTFPKLEDLLTRYRRLLEACRAGSVPSELLDEIEAASSKAKLDYLLGEIPAALSDSMEGLERVTKIVRAMKDFSHPGQQGMCSADLNKAIESTVTVARNEWKYVAEMVLDLDPSIPPVSCMLGDINQVILNIVVNAAHAVADVAGKEGGDKGTITLSTRAVDGSVEIRIQDTGTGIPEAHRGRVFDHFFTTKDVGKGTGQGLAIARQVIVEKHHGSLTFETETGKGTTFIIRLPIETKPMASTESVTNEHACATG